jgi:TPP-dependent pyruvate/acetoin dehydrogenase alpha subunit
MLYFNAMSDDISIYEQLYRIRRFEETLLDNFSKGVFAGTAHTCLGQEANAVGVLRGIHSEDIVFSNHRSHGHFLAYGGDMRALFAELMGKSTGVCGGRGGSQHLHWRNFYSNGIQGGIVPIASGMALAEKKKRSGALVTAFLGDGTFGEGVVYETLNMASLWGVPILFVVENNHIAQTTPDKAAIAGSLPNRFKAFNIPSQEIDTSDVQQIRKISISILEEIRTNNSPQALIISTCRFGPHSKGDDTRDESVIDQLKKERDPIQIQANRLNPDQKEKIEQKVDQEVMNSYNLALSDPFPDKSSIWIGAALASKSQQKTILGIE